MRRQPAASWRSPPVVHRRRPPAARRRRARRRCCCSCRVAAAPPTPPHPSHTHTLKSMRSPCQASAFAPLPGGASRAPVISAIQLRPAWLWLLPAGGVLPVPPPSPMKSLALRLCCGSLLRGGRSLLVRGGAAAAAPAMAVPAPPPGPAPAAGAAGPGTPEGPEALGRCASTSSSSFCSSSRVTRGCGGGGELGRGRSLQTCDALARARAQPHVEGGVPAPRVPAAASRLESRTGAACSVGPPRATGVR